MGDTFSLTTLQPASRGPTLLLPQMLFSLMAILIHCYFYIILMLHYPLETNQTLSFWFQFLWITIHTMQIGSIFCMHFYAWM
ncbi:hypothetical protein GDO81_014481 [Engystomops pustulosus]|uniref:Uncharacterized protein n=1 Tax=Engystomops pustulosus TaxID=76066 RepID=A0AAV7BAI7_ENGPU|nr:hypothetical protein GDO81_014481 [Engystomops pustulosus]